VEAGARFEAERRRVEVHGRLGVHARLQLLWPDDTLADQIDIHRLRVLVAVRAEPHDVHREGREPRRAGAARLAGRHVDVERAELEAPRVVAHRALARRAEVDRDGDGGEADLEPVPRPAEMGAEGRGGAERGEGEQDEDRRAEHRPRLSRVNPGGSSWNRADGAPRQYVPLADPVSVGRPRCAARSRIAFQASFDGSACAFSHRFTVETVTAIWCANSSCVMPSCWRRVRIRLRVLSGMRARLSNRRATRSGARPLGSTRRSPLHGGKKQALATRSRRVTCARQQHLAMAGAMIYVHEVHEVLGGRMEAFGDAVRREWRPLVEDGDRARLLWFWQLTHGTGPSYQAVSITAVRDWATWGELVGDPRLRAWQRRG